jgi:hypothetical protein
VIGQLVLERDVHGAGNMTGGERLAPVGLCQFPTDVEDVHRSAGDEVARQF